MRKVRNILKDSLLKSIYQDDVYDEATIKNSDMPERASRIEAQINAKLLEKLGLDAKTVASLQGMLLVYSQGFFEMIKDIKSVCTNPSTTIANIWKLFAFLLAQTHPDGCAYKMDIMTLENETWKGFEKIIGEREQDISQLLQQEKEKVAAKKALTKQIASINIHRQREEAKMGDLGQDIRSQAERTQQVQERADAVQAAKKVWKRKVELEQDRLMMIMEDKLSVVAQCGDLDEELEGIKQKLSKVQAKIDKHEDKLEKRRRHVQQLQEEQKGREAQADQLRSILKREVKTRNQYRQKIEKVSLLNGQLARKAMKLIARRETMEVKVVGVNKELAKIDKAQKIKQDQFDQLSEKLASLKQKCEELLQQRMNNKQTNADIQADLDRLMASLKKANKELVIEEEALEVCLSRVSDADVELERRKEHLNGMEKTKQRLAMENKTVKQDIQRVRTQTFEFKEKRQQLVRKLKMANAQREEQEKYRAHLRAQKLEILETNRKVAEAAQDDLRMILNEKELCQTNIEGCEASIASDKEKIAAICTTIENYSQEIVAQKERLKQNIDLQAQLEQDIVNTKARTEEAKVELKRIELNLEKLTEEGSDLEATITEINGKLAELDSVEAQHRLMLKMAEDDNLGAINDLKRELKDLDEHRKVLERQHAEEIENSKNDLAELIATRDRRKVEMLEGMERSKKLLVETKQEEDKLSREEKETESQKENMIHLLTTWKFRRRELEASRDKLVSSLAKTNGALDEVKGRLEHTRQLFRYEQASKAHLSAFDEKITGELTGVDTEIRRIEALIAEHKTASQTITRSVAMQTAVLFPSEDKAIQTGEVDEDDTQSEEDSRPVD